jgi:hypothetical protein
MQVSRISLIAESASRHEALEAAGWLEARDRAL